MSAVPLWVRGRWPVMIQLCLRLGQAVLYRYALPNILPGG